MADEAKKTYASAINHIVNGASVNDGAFSQSSDIDAAITSANHYDYPFADIVFTAYWTGTAAVGSSVCIYRRDMNIVGSNSEPVPSVNRKATLVGSLIVDNDEPTYYVLKKVALTKECEFYIENRTGATMQNNAWDLDVIPWTYAPGT